MLVVVLLVPPLRWNSLSRGEVFTLGEDSSARPRDWSIGVPALGKAREAADGRTEGRACRVQLRTAGAADRARGAIAM